jgi:predicted metal-dependent phosphoesterase TrpH
MQYADLHAHTTVSDGSLTPRELVVLAAEKGLAALGITDHDTTDAVAIARGVGEELGVWVVPGIELNTDTADGHVDILGYFIDITNEAFQGTLSRIRDARYHRARKMVDRLWELGMPVTFDRVLELSTEGAVGRPHVAEALLEAGHVSTIGEAFDLYIGRRGPAYVDRYRMSPVEACELVRRAGGVPSLAHPINPYNPQSDADELSALLVSLKAAGLGALECYYPGYDDEVIRWLLDLADEWGLVPSGGSDFHGSPKPHIDLGMMPVPFHYVEQLQHARISTP